MKDGFIKVAAITPEVRVADVTFNCEEICRRMQQAVEAGIKIAVFPELCITGYTCQDLFRQDRLLEEAREALVRITKFSGYMDCIFFVGLPLRVGGKLYNVAAAISRGRILGLVPKTCLPYYNEYYEARYFRSGKDLDTSIRIGKQSVPIRSNILFVCQDMPELKIGVELCEDLWVPNSPSIGHAMAGANVIVNLSASDEVIGKNGYRRTLIAGQSARLVSGYIYASAGNGESTQDVVYSGHDMIAENGVVLKESDLFTTGMISSELDIKALQSDRMKMTTFEPAGEETYLLEEFHLALTDTVLTRRFPGEPFVPAGRDDRDRRCNEILMIQAMGLKKRLSHVGCRSAVVGISGGLDSTLALLVTARAFDLLGYDRSGIIAVTMPGFGTTDRTYENAVRLIKNVGATFREISIVKAVRQHFTDIGQDPKNHDITYENSQARERTQILMDIANQTGGLVVGTGDMSELALGWATYNGDHMSMYAVNCSVPKTLVRHLVRYYADTCGDETLSETLYDVIATPVSPELLPPSGGDIVQKTEDLVGPYRLHDFFLYHMLRYGSDPLKIYRLALTAFREGFTGEEILKWEKVFYRRFFAQHYKRSCLPDGPKVGSVALSPRGDLRMPTDASADLWLRALDTIKPDANIANGDGSL